MQVRMVLVVNDNWIIVISSLKSKNKEKQKMCSSKITMLQMRLFERIGWEMAEKGGDFLKRLLRFLNKRIEEMIKSVVHSFFKCSCIKMCPVKLKEEFLIGSKKIGFVQKEVLDKESECLSLSSFILCSRWIVRFISSGFFEKKKNSVICLISSWMLLSEIVFFVFLIQSSFNWNKMVFFKWKVFDKPERKMLHPVIADAPPIMKLCIFDGGDSLCTFLLFSHFEMKPFCHAFLPFVFYLLCFANSLRFFFHQFLHFQ